MIVAVLVGAASGLFASMGLGGGFVLLVYLIIFGEDGQLASQGQNLVFFIPVIALSLIFHFKNKLVDLRSALICGGVGACFVFFGYSLASSLDSDLLKKLFAGFIIIAGLKDLIFKPKKSDANKSASP